MGLYKLFSCNVEIQYKSCLLSKAMCFTLLTAILTVVLPFIIANRSRGFWLKSYNFHEQPLVHFTYEYLLVAETDDPSQPIVCGEGASIDEDFYTGEEYCAEIQVQEHDKTGDGKNDVLDFKFYLNLPPDKTITSLVLFIALDMQLKTVCPLQMQSLAVISHEFAVPPSGFKVFGDLEFHQIAHLPCLRNHLDTKYNNSMFNYIKDTNANIVDFILENYFQRDVTTKVNTLYSRSQNGHTGMMDIKAHIRVPEFHVHYTPSLLQELKWAWPQYLSLMVIFHWMFNKIKRFVFNNRLLMAWEVIPWKK